MRKGFPSKGENKALRSYNLVLSPSLSVSGSHSSLSRSLFLCISVSVFVCVYLSVCLSLTQTWTHTREANGRTLFCNSYRIWSRTKKACSVCVWAVKRRLFECSQESMAANRLPGSPGTRPWACHCLIMAVISLMFPHNPLKTCGNSIFPFSFSYLENIAMSVFTSSVIPGLSLAAPSSYTGLGGMSLPLPPSLCWWLFITQSLLFSFISFTKQLPYLHLPMVIWC